MCGFSGRARAAFVLLFVAALSLAGGCTTNDGEFGDGFGGDDVARRREHLTANWENYPRYRFSADEVIAERLAAETFRVKPDFNFPNRFDADLVLAFFDSNLNGSLDSIYQRDPNVSFPINYNGLVRRSGDRIGSPLPATDSGQIFPGFCGDIIIYGETIPTGGASRKFFMWIALQSATFQPGPQCDPTRFDFGIGSYDPLTGNDWHHATHIGGQFIGGTGASEFMVNGQSGTQLPSNIGPPRPNVGTISTVGDIDTMVAGDFQGTAGTDSRRVGAFGVQFNMPFLEESSWSGSYGVTFAPTGWYLDGQHPPGTPLTAVTPDTMEFDREMGGPDVWRQQTLWTGINYKTMTFTDVSGDGRDDVCYVNNSDLYCHTAQSNRSFGSARSWSALFGYDDLPSDNQWLSVRFPDLNGDGRSDVCARRSGGIQCALSTGSSFASARYWHTNFSNSAGWHSHPSYWKTIRYPDINGDGRADICGRGSAGIYCATSNGSTGFTGFRLASNFFSNANSWSASPSYYETIQFADLDGDGRDDVCARGSTGIYCARSTGSQFGTASQWHGNFRDSYGWGAEKYWQTIQLGDLNGDGRADLCGRGTAGVYCAASLGHRFDSHLGLKATAFSDANGWGSARYYRTVKLMDVTGDGAMDICGSGHEGIWCANAEPNPASSHIRVATTRRVIDGMADSDGVGGSATYWSTIQAAEVDGDAPGEICANSPRGFLCSR